MTTSTKSCPYSIVELLNEFQGHDRKLYLLRNLNCGLRFWSHSTYTITEMIDMHKNSMCIMCVTTALNQEKV